MRAAIFKGKGHIELGKRSDPKIQEPADAIVRVVLACVCGSDLWYYRGIVKRKVDTPIGHELILYKPLIHKELAAVVNMFK